MKEIHLVDPITGLRRLLYIISPNESSFATLEEVPEYVPEVNTFAN